MIKADPRLREELRLCQDMGIPHSRFLGWPELDQDKALAYAQVQAETCPQCNTRPEEWDPAVGGDRHAYAATVHICPGCQATGDMEHELRSRQDESSGRYVVLLPRHAAEERKRQADERRAARRRALTGVA